MSADTAKYYCRPPLGLPIFYVYATAFNTASTKLTDVLCCSREKMAQAYDFALDKIGMDVMSYPIWSEYISFLKSV